MGLWSKRICLMISMLGVGFWSLLQEASERYHCDQILDKMSSCFGEFEILSASIQTFQKRCWLLAEIFSSKNSQSDGENLRA